VEVLRPFPGMRHLDVAGGTGDVAFRVLSAIQAAEAAQSPATPSSSGGSGAAAAASSSSSSSSDAAATAAAAERGHVTVFDINGSMLQIGKSKAAKMGLLDRTSWVQGDAEKLPFDDESMDAYTIAFGIRNVTDRMAALREARRVLKPGGRFLCLEFSQVGGGSTFGWFVGWCRIGRLSFALRHRAGVRAMLHGAANHMSSTLLERPPQLPPTITPAHPRAPPTGAPRSPSRCCARRTTPTPST